MEKYYLRDSGGIVKKVGGIVSYLSKYGEWVESPELFGMFIGGDSDFDEIKSMEVEGIIKSRKEKYNIQ